MPSKSNSKSKTPVPPYLQPGTNVEVCSDEEGFRGSWFTATIVRRASAKEPNKYLIEYHKLYGDESGKKHLREMVDATQIRPEVPREERKFGFSEHVDALCNDGWWEGVITEECENGKFAVFFRRSREQIVFEAKDLRLHREWVDGEWKPPLEGASEEFEQPLNTSEMNSGKPMSRKKVVPKASPTSVTKVRESKKRTKSGAVKSPLMNTSEMNSGKPISGEKVVPEASPTSVTKVRESKKRSKSGAVKSPHMNTSEMNSGKPISGEKVVPEASPTSVTKVRESKKRTKSGSVKSPHMSDANSESVKEKFSKGMLVEVSSDEDGLKGAWFAATIVEVVGKDKYLVQYESLKTEDDTGFLREEIDILHIRPRPPETIVVDCFKLMDEVDAYYNDAWWLGLIYKVRPNSRYLVYFKDTNEELVFNHSDLRLHQDWIDGKWITASQGLA